MSKDYQKLCICKMCPTYVKCSEPIAYCVEGIEKSKCITRKVGCICPGCPVYDEKSLTKDYYCITGEKI